MLHMSLTPFTPCSVFAAKIASFPKTRKEIHSQLLPNGTTWE